MIVVYTTIFGGSDSLKPAPSGADRCVCFVDDPDQYPDAKGWELWKKYTGNPRRDAWQIRCNPHVEFVYVHRSVWIDASFTLTNLPKLLKDSKGHALSALRHHGRSTCYEEGAEVVRAGQSLQSDVARQLAGYTSEGFSGGPLSISCIIVREHSNAVADFNRAWSEEIRNNPGDNTQLSLDYCAWKTGIGVHPLQGVRKDNPYAVHDHSDHKRRRKPYR